MTQIDKQHLEAKAKQLKIGCLKKHLFICTGPKCIESNQGLLAWEHLKSEIRTKQFQEIYRTKVGCLRVCQHGPIGLLYPEGDWLHSLTHENIDRLLDSISQKISVPEDLIFAHDPLNHE